MASKPAACTGCPFQDASSTYVPDELREVPVMILGQNPGADEERAGRPFVGKTGASLEETYLPLAGLERTTVSLGNVIRCRWHGTNSLPAPKVWKAAADHCQKAYFRPPAATRLIVCQGAVPWGWCQDGSITDWRGFLGEEKVGNLPVYATLHTADLFRDRKMASIARLDWRKVPRILAGDWPQSIPQPLVVTEGCEQQMEELFDAATHADTIAMDTEYTGDGTLTLLGMGWRAPSGGPPCGLQLGWLSGGATRGTRRRFIQRLARLVSSSGARFVFHNALADLPVLRRAFGLEIPAGRVDDTMLAHACLWSELPHDLGFLASVYSQYPKLKHLAGTDQLAYNWGDVLATLDAWTALSAGLASDPGALQDYRDQRLPLIPIIQEAHDHGLQVNGPRVETALTEYRARCDEASALAAVYCGWPINIGSSKQLADWLYGVEGLPVQKHKSTKKATADDDAINALRAHVGPAFDSDDEQRNPPTLGSVLERIVEGGNGVLESRAVYSAARQLVSHYFEPMVGRARIYPRFATHAQANRRWSTTDPPLAQLPEDLRDCVMPDVGTAWIGWDWKAIEPRLFMGYARSQFLQQVFEKDWDIHTIGLCDVMGWEYPNDLVKPHNDQDWVRRHTWQGSGDKRRRLSKVIRYKKYFGGNDASTIPGIHLLNLPKHKLRQAGDLILKSDPDLQRWMRHTAGSIAKTPIARDFTGARRALLGSSGQAAAREAYNFPTQSGVRSIANFTAIEIKRRVPYAIFAYEMHDSQWWAVPIERKDEALTLIKPIVEKSWDICGMLVQFPATFKIVENPRAV